MAKDLNQLIIRHKQNAETHSCDVGEDDYKKFESTKKLLERLSEIENCTYSVLDMDKNIYLLKSSKFKRVLGYVNPDDIENDDLELFHRIIHPDDLPFVMAKPRQKETGTPSSIVTTNTIDSVSINHSFSFSAGLFSAQEFLMTGSRKTIIRMQPTGMAR